MSCHICFHITGHSSDCPNYAADTRDEVEALRLRVSELEAEVDRLKSTVQHIESWMDSHKSEHDSEAYSKKMEGF